MPGSYSEVDASGLASQGLGATGIVAVLGTAEGGRPASTMERPEDFLRFTRVEKMRKAFRSGDLREAGDMLFDPSSDPEILAGAQSVVAMKVNPATQSIASFANAQGNVIDVESLDYGAFTSQINVTIQTGTDLGSKLLTIRFEDAVESTDNLGGDNIFTLQYSGGTHGWGTAVASVTASGISTTGTRVVDGEADAITTQFVAAGLVEVLSSNVGDVGQLVTIFGTNAADTAAQRETVVLNGTTVVTSTLQFRRVLGVVIAGTTTLGTVTVRAAPAGATVISLGIGVMQEGAFLGEYMFVNATTISLAADGATTKQVLIFGKNAAGADAQEIRALTGTTPVLSVGSYSQITALVLGDVEAVRNVTTTAVMAVASSTVQTTIKKAADYFNAKQTVLIGPITRGFILTIVTTSLNFLLADLDYTVVAANIKDPATGSFKADIFAIVSYINQNSQLISAARVAATTGGAPTNTANPVFLTGGTEGVATFADYQAALNLLKQTRINTIVPLTGDPAVHAAVDAHCAYMGGIGRSERDAVVGALNAGLTDVPSKLEYQQQIQDLNSRHIRVWGQAVERFNTSGERQEFLPTFGAAVVAGMQAGGPVGTPLTFKFMNILGFRQHSSWNPTDDAEEMIQSGAIFAENVEGVGRRIVRNLTSHLIDDNLAFTEASVNQAVNFAVFNFRTNMEFAVGKRGFSGTVNAARGIAVNTLGLLVDAGSLVAFQSLDLELVLDVLEVSVEMAPVLPINFVQTTVHLVTVRQAAA